MEVEKLIDELVTEAQQCGTVDGPTLHREKARSALLAAFTELQRKYEETDQARLAMVRAASATAKEADKLQRRCEQLERELDSLNDDAKECERHCWYCASPDAGDPERHVHDPQGGHWHHYIDPGDGLPSPCKNSEMLERIFSEMTRQLSESQAEVERVRQTWAANYQEQKERADGLQRELAELRAAAQEVVEKCYYSEGDGSEMKQLKAALGGKVQG